MKSRIKKIGLLIGIVITVLLIAFFVLLNYNNDESKNNTIIATKTILTENNQTKQVKYIIKIKNYEIKSAKKEIQCLTKEEAQLEYNRYEIINKYEKREYELELKNKKLIVIMSEKQLKLDLEYNKNNIVKVIDKEGKAKEIIDQNVLKQCLMEQDYKIK